MGRPNPGRLGRRLTAVPTYRRKYEAAYRPASGRRQGPPNLRFFSRTVDPDPHPFSLLDPDPGGKGLRKKLKKRKEIGSTVIVIFENNKI